MKTIHDSKGHQFQVDPDASPFLFRADDTYYVVSAKTSGAAGMCLRIAMSDLGQPLLHIEEVRDLRSRLSYWTQQHDPATVKAVIVFPHGSETDVYVLDRLPKNIDRLDPPTPDERRVPKHYGRSAVNNGPRLRG